MTDCTAMAAFNVDLDFGFFLITHIYGELGLCYVEEESG